MDGYDLEYVLILFSENTIFAPFAKYQEDKLIDADCNKFVAQAFIQSTFLPANLTCA
jgi:hypothetical protein